jgi:hypothetical protein
MDFKKYLTFQKFETFLTSMFPNQKASILSKILKNHCVINNGILYEVNQNMTYRVTRSEIKMKLLKIATLLIHQSYLFLPRNEQMKLTIDYPKQLKSVFSNSNVEKFYPQLYADLENNDIKFDDYICEIHFNNGYMDLKTLEFKPRILHKHYITEVIKRDYVQSTSAQQKEVLKPFSKIYPKNEDFDNILLVLGSCLSGKANIDQDTLFLLGKGSSGKSFTLELTKASIEIYLKELKSDTFTNNNAKADKILNTFNKSPFVRISWINEMEDKKMDDSLFKAFCDGKAQTTVLYQDGSNSIELKSKAIVTANNMPNIKIDKGTTRRILSYTHKSNFVDHQKDVDESQHIYLKDKELINKLKEQPSLLNAWFDILASHCNRWLNGEKLQYNKNFEETKLDVTASNDIFQDFLDSKVKITNDPENRVGKNEMSKAFNLMYPTKFLTVQQIINSLKEKGLKYEGTFRCKNDGVKGVFMCCKLEDVYVNDSEDEEEDDIDYYKLYQNALKEIAELKKQIQNK